MESAEIQRLKKIIADLQSGKKVAALEGGEEAPEEAGAASLEEGGDDSKYLHGTDFDRDDGQGEGGDGDGGDRKSVV